MGESSGVALLGPGDVRALTSELGIRPTKKLGQNFVRDPNTVRRIVGLAELRTGDHVLEVGPGLGSLTLGLLEADVDVTAVEVDEVLAKRLEGTVAERAPAAARRLSAYRADALRLESSDLASAPTVLVANLPYNIAVPVVLHLLRELPTLRRALVMVQTEVADRMAAEAGSRIYGVPSVKLAWYGSARKAGTVPRSVFWPVPNVDSALVHFRRHETPLVGDRASFFSVVDAAFAQRRKTLRGALATWAGSADRAQALLRAADIDPSARGEQLTPADFARLARVRAP